jgi:hypothetical protein
MRITFLTVYNLLYAACESDLAHFVENRTQGWSEGE